MEETRLFSPNLNPNPTMRTQVPLTRPQIQLLIKSVLCYRREAGAVTCTLKEMNDYDQGRYKSEAFVRMEQRQAEANTLIDTLRLFL